MCVLACVQLGCVLMLSFDIETLGLDADVCLITVAGIYDGESGVNTVFRFVEKDDGRPGGVKYTEHVLDTIEEFLCNLDRAETLTAYNGIQFDIPFIQKQFNVPNERVQAWVLKTYDTFEFCSKVLHRTFPLNLILQLNGFQVKSGDGLQAVRFAEREQWHDLEAYCADDARLTWDLAQKTRLILPEGPSFRRANKKTHDPSKALCLYVSNESKDNEQHGFNRSRLSFGVENLLLASQSV